MAKSYIQPTSPVNLEKFFDTAEKNKLVFMELLFWSNPREGIEIIEGYEENSVYSKARQKKSHWSEEVMSLLIIFIATVV